jgi:hypothetical protein
MEVTTTMIYKELKSLRKDFEEFKNNSEHNFELEKQEWKKSALKHALKNWDEADELINY